MIFNDNLKNFDSNVGRSPWQDTIYRLKQKLYKLDQNLSFSLINKNGLYCLKYNDLVKF